MHRKINIQWLILIILAGLFSIAYLANVVFPGKVNPTAFKYFTIDQIQSARAYNFIPRLSYITSFITQAIVLIWFAFSNKGAAIARWVENKSRGNFWVGVLFYFLLIWIILSLVRLPLILYSDFFWQHSWGLSTQSLLLWWQDFFKSAIIDLFLSVCGVLFFFFILTRWPKFWWIIGAAFLAVWLVFQNLLWPVIVAPLFNKFVVVKDPDVTSVVTRLADKAGMQVKEVLVMDASRRTTMVNAYFTGLGKTKRIVAYDNLLNNYPLEKVSVILAHEFGHWSKGHIIKGLALGIIGTFLVWAVMVFFLSEFKSSKGFYLIQTWAGLQLFIMLILFVINPLQSFVSREMEIQADRFALELTGDSKALVNVQIDLTIKNKSDVSPPEFIVWFGYNHPPVLSRINELGG
ncbi:MAG: M48 family metallopeptidase [Desulfitobacteriaceae bacterium]|nr:M48 family metallopeptidase [Desulfitobacteriaceae bacterium]MDD4346358.1 M48 family metallopeptidase [Desulfitobacteriaceae bacterium]